MSEPIDFDVWQALWLRTAEERGHVLARDEDGDINVFAAGVTGGIHNGPHCTRCGWGVCMHCAFDPQAIPECTAVEPSNA